jgi:hippurate hydrolase
MHRKRLVLAVAALAVMGMGGPAEHGFAGDGTDSAARIEKALPELLETYRSLHAAPELSGQEVHTSAAIAQGLRALGYDISEKVGQYDIAGLTPYGVVGVLRNGSGPTVLLRADMDALPIAEKTGLPFASRATGVGVAGEPTPVMHACGHDIHMTCLLAAARVLADMRQHWQGTLVLVAQPAEELGSGARALLADGLYQRFPKPDYALALHINPDLVAGQVGVVEGYAMAAVDSYDIIVRGVGGHGAAPHRTKDPVVMAAQVVMALQTIVSREKPPLDSAVVTVGSIHGGARRNIIPDEVRLELTIRTYRESVRRDVLAALGRIARGVAMAAGAPEDRAPLVIDMRESSKAVYNDPTLTRRLASAWARTLGEGNVATVDPVMIAEDFSEYALDGQVPSCLFWLGTSNRGAVEAARSGGAPLPPLHSAELAPLAEPSIRTGARALVEATLEILGRPVSAPAR